MGWPGVFLVTSFYRRRSAEHSRLPERTWGCPIEHAFGGKKNDCPRKPVKDPVWNASCILGGHEAVGHWLLGSDWVFLANGTCPDKGEGMSFVQQKGALQGQGNLPRVRPGEVLTMPPFNSIVFSWQKRRVKMIFQILLLTVRHMVPGKGIYEETPFLKLLPRDVSPRVKRGWAPCRLGFLGISSLISTSPPPPPPLPSPSPRQHFSLRFHFLPPLCFVLIIPR